MKIIKNKTAINAEIGANVDAALPATVWFADESPKSPDFGSMGSMGSMGADSVVVVVISGKCTEIVPLSCLTIMLKSSLHWTGIMSRLSPMIFSTEPSDAVISWLSKSDAELPHLAFNCGIMHWLWAKADSHNRRKSVMNWKLGVLLSTAWSWFVDDMSFSFWSRQISRIMVVNWFTHGIVLSVTSFRWLVQIIWMPLIVLLTLARKTSSGHFSKQPL